MKVSEPVDTSAVLAELEAERDRIAALEVVQRDSFHFDWYKVEAKKALRAVEEAIEICSDSEKRAELALALGKARRAFAEAVEKSCVIVINAGQNLDKAEKLAAIERRIRNFRRHHEAAESAFKRMTGYEYNGQLFAADSVTETVYDVSEMTADCVDAVVRVDEDGHRYRNYKFAVSDTEEVFGRLSETEESYVHYDSANGHYMVNVRTNIIVDYLNGKLSTKAFLEYVEECYEDYQNYVRDNSGDAGWQVPKFQWKKIVFDLQRFATEQQIVVVSPRNDAEAIAICELVAKSGNQLVATEQSWGASWDGLEDAVKAEIASAVAAGKKIYGVELQGAAPEGCVNVDHHRYDGDDRSNPLSSIEQIAEILGVELNEFEKAVALNDRGYIPVMIEAGVPQELIDQVRRLDRSAQGIAESHEEEAKFAVANRRTYGSVTIVDLDHSKCATVTDRLFGQYENLLILCGDGETDFYGSGDIIAKLSEKFGGWSGGNLPKSGFWGCQETPDLRQADVKRFVLERCVSEWEHTSEEAKELGLSIVGAKQSIRHIDRFAGADVTCTQVTDGFEFPDGFVSYREVIGNNDIAKDRRILRRLGMVGESYDDAFEKASIYDRARMADLRSYSLATLSLSEMPEGIVVSAKVGRWQDAKVAMISPDGKIHVINVAVQRGGNRRNPRLEAVGATCSLYDAAEKLGVTNTWRVAFVDNENNVIKECGYVGVKIDANGKSVIAFDHDDKEFVEFDLQRFAGGLPDDDDLQAFEEAREMTAAGRTVVYTDAEGMDQTVIDGLREQGTFPIYVDRIGGEGGHVNSVTKEAIDSYLETAVTSSEATTVSENPDLSAAENSGAESENNRDNSSSVETVKEVNNSTENSEGPSAEDAEAKTTIAATNSSKEVNIMVAKFARDVNGHRGNNRLIKKMSKKLGNMCAQVVKFVPWENGTVRAKMATVPVQVTPLNVWSKAENVLLQTPIGLQSYKVGSHDFVVADFSAVTQALGLEDWEHSCMVQRLKCQLIVARIDGEDHAVMPATIAGAQIYVDLSGKLADDGSFNIVDEKLLKTEKGNWRKNVRLFSGNGGCEINSSSQGRKDQMVYWNVTTKANVQRYLKAINAAIMDGYDLAKAMIGQVDMGEAAELCTRLSSKTTAMSMTADDGCVIDTIVVKLRQDDGNDGAFYESSGLIHRNAVAMGFVDADSDQDEAFEGNGIQSRPFEIKGESIVVNQNVLDQMVENETIYEIDVKNHNGRISLRDAAAVFNKIMRKRGHNPFIGYTAVKIYFNGTGKPVDLVCDLNTMKDQFNLKKRSGLNIMAFAHQDNTWKAARTSGQMLKCPLRAIQEYPELRPEFDEIVRRDIREQIDEDFDFSAKPKNFGSSLIDCGYVPLVARDLNPSNIGAYPFVMKGMITDAKNRAEGHVNLDAYYVSGHPGVITADIAYAVWGKGVLTINDKFVRVYDPSFNRYARENGITETTGLAIKYPSMGAYEILFVDFVSDEEYLRLVAELGKELGKTDEQVEAVLQLASRIKEGLVLIPAELAKIARIAAGSDEDGDKLIIYFPENRPTFVSLMWKALELGYRSRAVEIGKPKKGELTSFPVDDMLFKRVMVGMIDNGNVKVGNATRGFQIFNDGLLQDHQQARDYYGSLFAALGAGTEDDGTYQSQVEVVEIDGQKVFKTTEDIIQRINAAIKKMANTWENIQAVLLDLDVAGRHVQELIIDAQKNFYAVDSSILDVLNSPEISYKLLNTVHVIKFDMNWDNPDSEIELIRDPEWFNLGYYVENGKVKNFEGRGKKRPDKDHVTYVLADAFVEYRKYAGTLVLEKLTEARQEFFRAVNNEELKNVRQTKFFELVSGLGTNQTALSRLEYTVKMATTANRVYREYTKAMREMYIDETMDTREALKIEADIRRAAHEKFDDMLAAITNELRVVAEDCGLTSADLVVYVSKGKDETSSLAGKLLKEETCRYLAARSEIRDAHYELRGAAAVAAMNCGETVEVCDGIIADIGVEAELTDGVWNVETTTDDDANTKVELVRPLTSLIEIPKADHTKVSFALDSKWINKIEELDEGTKVSLKLEKIQKPGKKYTVDAIVMYANGEAIAEVYCGKIDSKLPRVAQPFWVNARRFNGLVGNFTGLAATAKDVKIADTRNFIVTISDVRREQVQQQKVTEVSQPVNNQQASKISEADWEEAENLFADR